MGMTLNNAALLLQARKEGARFDRILTIGHLDLYLTVSHLERLARHFGMEVDARRVAEDRFADRFFASYLGATTVDSLDYAAHEDCTIVHDMNSPVDPVYHDGYDAVIDGGSLEHVFNFPIAVANCMQMVKPGGRLFIFTMCNNHTGHGFYQFSPELFFRLLTPQRGFMVKDLILERHPFPSSELTENRECYSVADPASLGTRVGLVSSSPVLMMVHAVKHASPPIYSSYPIQSDYQAIYDGEGNPLSPGRKPDGVRNGLLGIAKQVVRRLPSRLRRYAEGLNELRVFSFRNRRFYKKWRWY